MSLLTVTTDFSVFITSLESRLPTKWFALHSFTLSDCQIRRMTWFYSNITAQESSSPWRQLHIALYSSWWGFKSAIALLLLLLLHESEKETRKYSYMRNRNPHCQVVSLETSFLQCAGPPNLYFHNPHCQVELAWRPPSYSMLGLLTFTFTILIVR